jgi:hypothetical protein
MIRFHFSPDRCRAVDARQSHRWRIGLRESGAFGDNAQAGMCVRSGRLTSSGARPFSGGFGEWRLEPLDQQTRVSYRLDVRANGWLVFCLGKLIDLAGVHSRSMQEVLKSLRHVLDQKKPGTNVGQ